MNSQEEETNHVLAIETIPFNVSSEEMVKEIRKDRILSIVYDYLLKGRDRIASISRIFILRKIVNPLFAYRSL